MYIRCRIAPKYIKSPKNREIFSYKDEKWIKKN